MSGMEMLEAWFTGCYTVSFLGGGWTDFKVQYCTKSFLFAFPTLNKSFILIVLERCRGGGGRSGLGGERVGLGRFPQFTMTLYLRLSGLGQSIK